MIYNGSVSLLEYLSDRKMSRGQFDVHICYLFSRLLSLILSLLLLIFVLLYFVIIACSQLPFFAYF